MKQANWKSCCLEIPVLDFGWCFYSIEESPYQEASNVSSSIPCCSTRLKAGVSGNGTLAAEKKEKVQNHAQLPLENSVISVIHISLRRWELCTIECLETYFHKRLMPLFEELTLKKSLYSSSLNNTRFSSI